MSEDLSGINNEEQLKTENDFLKMKLMLEHGAQFGGDKNTALPSNIENEFLNNMMLFEKQFEERKRIKVYDKIERPLYFRPSSEINDDEINNAWSELNNYLNKYNIDLAVCSPNVSVRELYRFTIEELFEHEMDNMDLPGWTTNFIYDEFHPDIIYENTNAAKDDCIKIILQKDPIDWFPHLRNENIRLNDHFPLSEDQLKSIINNFKIAYDILDIEDLVALECTVTGQESIVTGNYSVNAGIGLEIYRLSGNWQVTFEREEDFGYWYIKDVQIVGINF